MGEVSRHPTIWTLAVVFDETVDHTDAQVTLNRGPGLPELHGWGRARRNPDDPDVPQVGEALATARALSELTHRLLDEAAHGIENFEGQAVHLAG